MIKKILLLLTIVIVSGWLYLSWKSKNVSKETITSDLTTEALFETRCGICHNGGSPDAPQLSALKLMPAERIVTAMKTGVMKNQAAMLSDKQHQKLASFISQVDSDKMNESTTKGICHEEESVKISNFIRIDNWGLGLKNHRYYAENDLKINKENVGHLQLDWVFAFPNASRARVQPTVSGNTIFTASQLGTIYALDRYSGCIIWTFQADSEVRSAIVIDRDSLGNASHLYFGDFTAQVYAYDLINHKLLWKKKIDEHPEATITGSLSIYEDQLFIPLSSTEIINAADENYKCCSFRGSIVAINKHTGNQKWKTFTIEEKPKKVSENSNGIDILGPSGAPIWTAITIDEKRRVLYVGTGENYTRPTTKTSDAIMAFSLDNGAILWTQQTMPDDAWNGACVTLFSRANCPENSGPDSDYGAPPILVNNGGRDLILAGQKSGFVYALDPDNNGTMIWKKQVGRGGTMGGIHWGMATDEKTLYVPINDRGIYDIHKDFPKSPGLHAVNINDGEILWSTIEKDRCPGFSLRGCGPGITAAITATPEVIFGGTLDGYLKAYSAQDGKELWSFDTKRDYDAVNKVKAFGGAIDSDGPIIVEDQLLITSGYAKFAEKEGNVLLSFRLKKPKI